MTLWTKTKLFLALKSAWASAQKIWNTKNPTPMKLKPGISTSEFWLSAGLGLGAFVLSLLDKLDGTWAAGAAVLLGGIYTAARTLAKSKEP